MTTAEEVYRNLSELKFCFFILIVARTHHEDSELPYLNKDTVYKEVAVSQTRHIYTHKVPKAMTWEILLPFLVVLVQLQSQNCPPNSSGGLITSRTSCFQCSLWLSYTICKTGRV